jgi:hypothetical protein
LQDPDAPTGVPTWNGSHQLDVPIVRFSEFGSDTQRIGDGVIVLQAGGEQKLESNKQAFFLEFVQRPRFTAAFPDSLTPEQYVDRLNQNAGNVLSSSERGSPNVHSQLTPRAPSQLHFAPPTIMTK